MNQIPTEEKPNACIRKIKTVQFIYIIKKVGLMNQAPTQEEQNPYSFLPMTRAGSGGS